MVIPQEVLKGKVLFELFEQQSDSPSILVNGCDSGCFQLEIVGQEDEKFLILVIPISDSSEF